MRQSDMSMEERFWTKVEKTETCWLWRGASRKRGYGVMRMPGHRGRNVSTHRYSAMLHFGMFDTRLHVLHHCDNPSCVNPDHLYLGTHDDNMRDMSERGRATGGSKKTHCLKGLHELTEENTYSYIYRNKIQRQCRPCALARKALR